MSAETLDQSLHLSSLVIKNFRGIDELTIPKLGRVTLLAGKNGIGKSTVLDAVKIYAARGHRFVLADVLHNCDEVVKVLDEDGRETAVADWDGLFFGRRIASDEPVSIGSTEQADFLQMRVMPLPYEELVKLARAQPDFFADEAVLGLEIKVPGSRRILLPHNISIPPGKRAYVDSAASPPDIVCNSLGPDVPSNAIVEEYLNDLALTPHEERAVEALNLVTDALVQRVALVDSGARGRPQSGRRVLVKVKSKDKPVPLRSLGEGAVRIFGVALALASSGSGFLLIDEVENGIHHSIQPKFWNMVLQTAQRNNVQVLVTTHSWDCVTGFARAAEGLEETEATLIRLERPGERLLAVTYSKRNLQSAAKYGIEVR